MRHRLVPVILLAGSLFAVGCGSESGLPTDQPNIQKSQLPPGTSDEAQINRLLHALLSQPDKRDANQLFARVKAEAAGGDAEASQAAMFELLDLVLNAELQEPEDMTAGDALSELTDLLFEYVGLEPPSIDPEDFDNEDAVVEVVTEDGGTTTTESGNAGVVVPAGAVEEDVLITIRRIDKDPCLPVDLAQLADCYEYERFPAGDFELPVTVVMCFDPGIYVEPQLSRFLLHKTDPEEPGEVVQVLQAVPDGDLPADVDCEGQVTASAESGWLGSFARNPLKTVRDGLAAVFVPRPLVASVAVAGTPKRLGGSSGSFTDIGAALPSEMEKTAGDNQTGEAGQEVEIAPVVTVTDVAGDPVQGATVRFAIQSGGGSVTPLSVVTDMNGEASPTWTLGAAGTNELEASGKGIADPGDGGPFIPAAGQTDLVIGTGSVVFTANAVAFFDGFETDRGWTASGFWHRSMLNVSNTAVGSIVDLAPDDASGGALPSPFGGSYALWYGQEATGNYMGSSSSTACGGTSTAANTGTVTSPQFTVPSGTGSVSLTLDSWFEIESVNPSGYDVMTVSVLDVVAATETLLGTLNPTSDPPGGNCATPFTSNGFNLAPGWSTVSASLDAFKGKDVQIVLRFSTEDALYNAFRGWVIDNVSVAVSTAPSAPAALTLKGSSVGGLRPYDPRQTSERSPQE